MGDKIRIGLIGAGQIGKVHLDRYKEVPEAEIVAVCDVREDEARRVAATYDIPHAYKDYLELLRRDDLDSVDVALHNRLHAATVIAALEHGKNVYCEKPLSWSYAEAKAMVDTAKRTGQMLHVQLNTLYEPEARAAKRLVQDGRLGKVYYGRTRHFRRRGRPYVDGYGTSAFVKRATAGGGAVLDMGVYHIARMLWLLEQPDLRTVSGSTYQMLENIYPDRREEGGYDVEEFGCALIRFSGDITYIFEEAWAIHAEDADVDTLHGSQGGLRLRPLAYYTTLSDMEMDGAFDVDSADWRWHQVDASTPGIDHSQRHWVWAQLGRVPLLDTAGLALRTSQIIEGIYLSAHLKREVTPSEIDAAGTEYRMA